MTTRALHLLFGLILLAACGGDPAAPDAARMDGGIEPEPDGARLCERDSDCDDELFCTGAERCAAGVCAAGTPPCDGDTPECDEEADRCAAVDCSDGGDADGDRHRSIACGGDDCDDDDPLRFAGAPEICDPDDRDEDCDPSTYGFRDADMDGDPDATCCNGDNCGTDCDDMRPGVNSTNPEVCGNGFDDDCDGTVDEGMVVGFVDFDGDGYGNDAMPDTACPGGGVVPMGGDCDDADASTFPGATEVCDHVDQDCDGRFDESASLATCSSSRTPDRCREPTFECRGTCAETATQALLGGTLATPDTPPGAAWFISTNGDHRVDLGRGTRISTSWRAAQLGSGRSGTGAFGIVVTPRTTLGADVVVRSAVFPGGTPPLMGAETGIMAVVTPQSEELLLFVYGGPSGVSDVVRSVPLGTCSADTSGFRAYSLSLTIDGPNLQAEVSGAFCPRTTVSYTLSSFWTSVYGEGADYPLYHLGAFADSDGEGMDLRLNVMSVERTESPERGSCESCPDPVGRIVCI